jgi:hypothetical protein
MMAEEHQIGDYWYGLVDWTSTWMVRTNTGIVTRHCKEDAIQTANVAMIKQRTHRKKQKESFQKQVEFLMDDMMEYYENLDDVAEDVKMWVGDYVSWTKQEASRP